MEPGHKYKISNTWNRCHGGIGTPNEVDLALLGDTGQDLGGVAGDWLCILGKVLGTIWRVETFLGRKEGCKYS